MNELRLKPESVWDYPRPPRVERCFSRIKVEFSGVTLANSLAAMRLLETSHPPTYYIPPTDIQMELLVPNRRRSFCEFKGEAQYWDIAAGSSQVVCAAWSYASPSGGYESLKDHLAFYSNKVDACFVDDERVMPQAGDFYGGWITANLKGPFKGGPGTLGW